MSRRYLILALIFTFVNLLTLPAWAQSIISGCTGIHNSGSYMLDGNITVKESELGEDVPGCIVIDADFVNLDLRGYTITGPGWQVGRQVFGVYSTANTEGKYPVATHIRNGSVTGFERGIAVEGAGHTVEGVRVALNGVGISMDGDGMRAKDVVAWSNWAGILCWSGNGNSVEHSQITSNYAYGISLKNPTDTNTQYFGSLGSRIVGNTVWGNGVSGIFVPCPSVILQNMVYKNGLGARDNIVIVTGSAPCTRAENNPLP